MRSLFILPSEVISHILCFLSPRDVIRLRVISKQFHDLSYDRALWRTLYRNARLPRPPGPFLSQSVQFFEHTLVQSERLADSWTTQPMEAVSAVGIRLQGYQSHSIIVDGKWLVAFDEPHKMLAYDLDYDGGSQPHQLLWESASEIYSWDACTVFSASELLVYIVFNTHTFFHVGPWKLLEFRMDGNSFHHTLTLNVPTRNRELPVFICGGNSPFSYIASQRLIFDTETRLFYGFPRFTSAAAPSDSDSSDPVTWVTLTNTHIISLFYHVDRTVSPAAASTLFQAFTIPTDSLQVSNGTCVLRLTHEGAVPLDFQDLDLIRNSIVNSLTGVTSIRILHQHFEGDSLHFSYIDLTLPNHTSTDAVLPITIDSHDITVVNHVPLNLAPEKEYHIVSSDDGYVRGLWIFGVPGNGSLNSLADALIMRFTIDSSRDKCVVVLGQISVPLWEQLERPTLIQHLLFDLARGMMCYDRNVTRGDDDDGPAVVTYIK
ncbi:hypothetical protein JVT61DRAFT_11904 [Boletus reticuloceps]|uniref:F-box domain-containing protein n=1 Tax=Boletus reticuloceps TaxID=495285 RepID=A0A8I2YU73_9AGAM|nr:hypothetical protein JVT61DRAFT_11904 [Boletus reticuloceps]